MRERVGDGLAPGDATIVWWRDRDRYGEATELAELLGADDLRMVDATTPRAVFDAGGDVVVQVGAAGR